MTDEIPKLLKDLIHFDSHFRQNAVRFLGEIYVKNYDKITKDDKNKIIEGFLCRLDEKEDALEVKEKTVRELGKMSKYLSDEEINQIFRKIAVYIIDEKIQGKDIYVLCMKELLKGSTAEACNLIGSTIIDSILVGLNHKDNKIRELSYDVLNDYIIKYDFVLTKEYTKVFKNPEKIYENAINNLSIKSISLMKKMASFIGNYSSILDKENYFKLIDLITVKLKESKDINYNIILFNCLTSIARNNARKNTEVFEKIFPFICKYISYDLLKKSSESSNEEFESANEIAESCLYLLEIYCLKHQFEISSRLTDIICILLQLVEYDPYYDYSNVVMDGENYDCYEDEYAYMDNDVNNDSSWKVRRAAVKVLLSLAKAKILTKDTYVLSSALKKLNVCIREREENTKFEILNLINEIANSLFTVRNSNSTSSNILSKMSSHDKKENYLSKRNSSNDIDCSKDFEEILNQIKSEMSKKEDKYTPSYLRILETFSLTIPSEVLVNLKDFFSVLKNQFKNNNENALSVICIFSNLSKASKENFFLFNEHIVDLLQIFKLGIDHSFYKINYQTSELIFVFMNQLINSSDNDFDKAKISNEIFSIIKSKFKNNEVDQQLKLSLTSTTGYLLIYFGNLLNFEYVNDIFDCFNSKLNNDNLKNLILTILIKLFRSGWLDYSKVDGKIKLIIDHILNVSMKQNNQIKNQSLNFFIIFISNCKNVMKTMNKELDKLKSILPDLLTKESESLISNIVDLLNMIYLDSDISEQNASSLLSKILDLLENEFVCDLSNLFNIIIKTTKSLKLESSKKMLSNAFVYKENGKLNNKKSKAIALIAKTIGTEEDIIKSCLDNIDQIIKNKVSDDIKESYYLDILSETCILYKYNGIFEKVNKWLLTIKDESKMHYAKCLGKISCFSTDLLIKSIDPKLHSYFVIALKESLIELIHQKKIMKVNLDKNQIAGLFEYMKKNISSNDLKIKSMASECIGIISVLDSSFVEKILELMNSNSENDISGALIGLKQIYHSKEFDYEKLDKLITNHIKCLKDESNFNIKQNAYSSLTNLLSEFSKHVLENKEYRKTLFESFASNYLVNKDLIETYDLGGGVKITNDKGLIIRKSIYTCINYILDTYPSNIDDWLKMILHGLNDNEEIKSIAFSNLNKIAAYSAHSFIPKINEVIDILKKIFENLVEKSKSNKENDLKALSNYVGETLRFLNELEKLPEIKDITMFNEFLYDVKKRV